VDFLVELQNQGRRFGIKTTGTIFSSLTSESVVEGFPIWSSKPASQFGDLGIKITTTVSWFGPQNQAGYDLSVAPQNRREGDVVGLASRSSGLLRVKATRARVFQFGLETGGGAMVGGARGIITEITSRSS
jgi:hypothetical protein